MKRFFAILAFMPLSCAVFGQAITITSTDMPVPTTGYNCEDISSVGASFPTISTAGSWNYGIYTGPSFVNLYTAETDTFFTNKGIDVSFPSFKTLNSTASVGYNIVGEFDFNTTNVQEKGVYIPAQIYDLSPYTGGTTDSLVIPEQKTILTTSREIMHFPFTAGTSWSSTSRRVTDLNITYSPLLDHEPGQHVYYVHRNDTIAGWGKLRVYTTAGPSIQYDVLVDKISQYSADSFYISGLPAPTSLLSMFDVTQGQHTDSNFRYNFYRKGYFNYLLSVYYGTDASFTTPMGMYYHKDNLVTEVGVDNVSNPAFSTVTYPNPSNGTGINILFAGKELNSGSYMVTDAVGKAVYSGTIAPKQGNIQIGFDNQLVTGLYFLTIIDTDGNKLVTEQFNVAN